MDIDFARFLDSRSWEDFANRFPDAFIFLKNRAREIQRTKEIVITDPKLGSVGRYSISDS